MDIKVIRPFLIYIRNFVINLLHNDNVSIAVFQYFFPLHRILTNTQWLLLVAISVLVSTYGYTATFIVSYSSLMWTHSTSIIYDTKI